MSQDSFYSSFGLVKKSDTNDYLYDCQPEDEEDVKYPVDAEVRQDSFFSSFGLVKKSELPADGNPNKLHRSVSEKATM